MFFSKWSNRDAQGFVETFEGALGKGKGKKLYAFKVLMTKVICSFCICLIQLLNEDDIVIIYIFFYFRN